MVRSFALFFLFMGLFFSSSSLEGKSRSEVWSEVDQFVEKNDFNSAKNLLEQQDQKSKYTDNYWAEKVSEVKKFEKFRKVSHNILHIFQHLSQKLEKDRTKLCEETIQNLNFVSEKLEDQLSEQFKEENMFSSLREKIGQAKFSDENLEKIKKLKKILNENEISSEYGQIMVLLEENIIKIDALEERLTVAKTGKEKWLERSSTLDKSYVRSVRTYLSESQKSEYSYGTGYLYAWGNSLLRKSIRAYNEGKIVDETPLFSEYEPIIEQCTGLYPNLLVYQMQLVTVDEDPNGISAKIYGPKYNENLKNFLSLESF
jgi:hypothetical protein